MQYKTFDINEFTIHSKSEELQIRTRKIFEMLKQKSISHAYLGARKI